MADIWIQNIKIPSYTMSVDSVVVDSQTYSIVNNEKIIKAQALTGSVNIYLPIANDNVLRELFIHFKEQIRRKNKVNVFTIANDIFDNGKTMLTLFSKNDYLRLLSLGDNIWAYEGNDKERN